MIGNRSQLMNFASKFLGTVRFRNDHITRIMGYDDYQLGNVTISRVYYVERLGYNLFYVGQFCNADLKVAFRKNACFIRNLEGVDLLSGSRDTNLYTISLDDMLKTSPICLLSKTSKTKSDNWDRLFQPMFDEYFNPPSIVVSPVQEVVALRAVILADSPVSTSIDQDASSTSIPSTQEQEHSPNISQDSTSQGSSSNVRQTHTPFEHLGRWTKDQPIANVIGDPSRSNFKQAMTEPSWIDALQEKIHEFERLEVWELVSCPDKVLLIKLKLIYKVKTDELGQPITCVQAKKGPLRSQTSTTCMVRYAVKLPNLTTFLQRCPTARCVGVRTLDLVTSGIASHTKRMDMELEKSKNVGEKRLEIGKCNRRLNLGKIQREPTFQVVLDALALPPCYSAFLITVDVPESTMGQDFDTLPTDEEIMSFLRDLGHTREIHSLNDVVVNQIYQPWRTFDVLINKSLSGNTSGLDKLCLSRAQILWDKTLSWRNNIGMHTFRDDYLINTLRFVSTKEETQIYDSILPESLTSPEIKETKDYKTSLGFATGATPPKKTLKYKKPSSPKLTTVPVSTEEPTGKSKRVKTPSKTSLFWLQRLSHTTPSTILMTEDNNDWPDKAKGDEDEEMDYTTSLLYDDVDIRLNEPVDTDKGCIHEKGTDAAMTNVQQRNENLEICSSYRRIAHNDTFYYSIED
ncbi:hypothetical protein Tco_0908133 [Tanacetum coccineum]|uniref:Integrase, catalytic region, zinc finger, CCHC-type, peptidase aspartic, catalytic n=1 Tax=Tanacetum coccineum TaxID=301880 RepID=A0ABQ5CND8_9ASTR